MSTDREEFEKWFTSGDLTCRSIIRSKTNSDGYKLMQTQINWTAFKAGAEHKQSERGFDSRDIAR